MEIGVLSQSSSTRGEGNGGWVWEVAVVEQQLRIKEPPVRWKLVSCSRSSSDGAENGGWVSEEAVE